MSSVSDWFPKSPLDDVQVALLTFPLASFSGTARWPTVAEVGIQPGCLVEGEEALDTHDG